MGLSWKNVLDRWNRAQVVAASTGATGTAAVTLAEMRRLSLLRPRVPVAVTGLRGTGKSLLYAALAGRINHDFRPPGKSLTDERHRVVLRSPRGTVRSALDVIPGQNSEEQRRAEEMVFGEGRYPSGVVHVVCWGHNTIWEAGSRDLIKAEIKAAGADFSMAAIHRRNLAEELEDFGRTANLLKDAWAGRGGVWLIVAVTKCDLYWPRIEAARDYYIPGAASEDSPFARELRALVGYLGSANLTDLAVLPVSAYPSPYEFDTEIDAPAPALQFAQSAALVQHFRSVVGEFCGA